jgi:hypothetical protein
LISQSTVRQASGTSSLVFAGGLRIRLQPFQARGELSGLELFSDFRARLNRMCSILRETWFSARFGYYSEETILVRAVSGIPTLKLSQELRQLNADCSRLISCFQAAKAGTAA